VLCGGGKTFYHQGAEFIKLRVMEITNLPFIVIVMPEWFYRASSKNSGFPLNSIAGMTAR